MKESSKGVKDTKDKKKKGTKGKDSPKDDTKASAKSKKSKKKKEDKAKETPPKKPHTSANDAKGSKVPRTHTVRRTGADGTAQTVSTAHQKLKGDRLAHKAQRTSDTTVVSEKHTPQRKCRVDDVAHGGIEDTLSQWEGERQAAVEEQLPDDETAREPQTSQDGFAQQGLYAWQEGDTDESEAQDEREADDQDALQDEDEGTGDSEAQGEQRETDWQGSDQEAQYGADDGTPDYTGWDEGEPEEAYEDEVASKGITPSHIEENEGYVPQSQWESCGNVSSSAQGEASNDTPRTHGEDESYTGEAAHEGAGGLYTQDSHSDEQQSPEISVIYLGPPATGGEAVDEAAQGESGSTYREDEATSQGAGEHSAGGAALASSEDTQGGDLSHAQDEDEGTGNDDVLVTEEARVAQAIASVFSAQTQQEAGEAHKVSAQPSRSGTDGSAGGEPVAHVPLGTDDWGQHTRIASDTDTGEHQSAEGGDTTIGSGGTSYIASTHEGAGTSADAGDTAATQEGGSSAAESAAFTTGAQSPIGILAEEADGGKKSVLRVSSLYKSFGRKTVVKGVEFSMTTGEVLGLLGPNGAGKTTTFYMIVGFYKPTSGDVFLDEKCITHLPMYKRARAGISYLPQEPSVFRKLTVEENIWAILETRKDLTRIEKKRKLNELIDEFAIGRIRKQPAYTLSGGERRRTEIARSLAIEPKFLLLDEPFAGIDPIAVADIKSMIRLLSKRGIGILITDHNVRDTLEITDRAIIISTGTILVSGGKEDILKSEEAREIYLGKDFSM